MDDDDKWTGKLDWVEMLDSLDITEQQKESIREVWKLVKGTRLETYFALSFAARLAKYIEEKSQCKTSSSG